MALLPPTDIAPARLFRSLLALPRPVERIAWRVPAAHHVGLCVRALSSLEVADALEHDDKSIGLVSAALCDRAGRSVLSASDIGLLTDAEFAAARAAVFAALGRMSPTYRLSDSDAWLATLRVGATQHMSTCATMWTCRESVGNRVVLAPEKYFGVPRGALLDCHWMAFRAAVAVYEQRRPKG